MLAAVQLDDQALFKAHKIDDEFSKGELTAEFQTFEGPAT
jgi:hypothetical protein